MILYLKSLIYIIQMVMHLKGSIYVIYSQAMI